MPSPLDRRRFLAGSFGTAGLVGAGTFTAGSLLSACSTATTPGSATGTTAAGAAVAAAGAAAGPPTDITSALAVPGSPGLVDEAVYQRRVDEYVRFATEKLDMESPTGVTAQLVRAHREPDFTWDTNAATVEALKESWDRFETWDDVRDFRVMFLLWMLALADGSTPSTTLSPELLAKTKRSTVDNRYRYDDPIPDGVVDNQVFLTENHIIIGLVTEYIAGKRFPTDTFTVTGLTGAQHAERSRQPILDWIDERARFGFFEWHSHVYMVLDITPLLTLVELDDDPEIVRAAGMALDLCLLDMAAHTHKGTYAASRGRSYKGDKMSARNENTFTANKFLFDDTDLPYVRASERATVCFCAAKRYRTPQVLLDIATAAQPGVVRERHGVLVDGGAPVTENPQAPYGLDFADPDQLPFWWSLGALGTWQTTDISLSEAKEHRLFEAGEMAQIKVLVDLNGGDPARVKAWTQANHAIVNFALASEANTYAWRGDNVTLASVVDHRFGEMSGQVHSWIAAIDADALVFTTHPVTPAKKTTDWSSDGKPGYWTGEASIPRSAQHERTGLHIYQPAWDETTDALLWAAFKYRPYTHAFFPQDHFDEVEQTGHWTVGKKGDGYIALWSWRAPTWREYDATVLATGGMTKPFDLVAEGGPDNVWVVEVGEKTDGDFAAWQQRITATEPAVERNTSGFVVRWTSPSSGEIAFGSTGPFTVKGETQPLADFPRHSSRFGTIDHLSKTHAVKSDTSKLQLDFDTMTRAVI